MSEAPERIWACIEPDWADGDGNPLVGGNFEDYDITGKGVEYIRADLSNAFVAAAYEAAAIACDDYPRAAPEEAEWTRYDEQIEYSQLVIRTLTPTDAQAALDAMLDAAREEGRREALTEAAYIACNACLVPPDGGNPTEDERLVCDEAYRRILALRDKKGAEG